MKPTFSCFQEMIFFPSNWNALPLVVLQLGEELVRVEDELLVHGQLTVTHRIRVCKKLMARRKHFRDLHDAVGRLSRDVS